MPFSGAGEAGIAGLFRVFWHYADGRRGRVVVATTLLVLSQSAKLLVPWLAAQAINAIQQGGADGLHQAGMRVLAIVAAVAFAWSLHGPGRIIERNTAIQVRRRVADRLYEKVTSLPLEWHHKHHSADTLHRMNQTSSALYEFAQNQFVVLQNAVNFVGPMVALWCLSTSIGVAAAIGYLSIAIVIVSFDHSLLRLARQENVAERRVAAGGMDFIGNVSTVLALRLQQATRGLLARRLSAVFVPLRRAIVLIEAKWCAVDMLSLLLAWALVALYVWLSQDPRAGTTLLIGNVFMVYQYTQQAGGVIGSVASNYQQFARIYANFQSAQPIWDAAPRPDAAATVPGAWQRVEIRSLQFAHPGGRAGLHDVALTLRRGERIALVGPSGSGKSTLMRVLAGLYAPESVAIVVDGQPSPGLQHLGSIATLIPQDAEVFEASVRENLAFGAAMDDEAIRRAARIAAFDPILARLPDGLDTEITERGLNLSGGQRQRLALARGVLAAADSSLIMLDEPTSSLDAVTEQRVFGELARAFPGACIVASVHRMSLLEHFDRVVLVVDGAIVDTGTPAELMARQPVFQAMASRTRRATDRPAPPQARAA